MASAVPPELHMPSFILPFRAKVPASQLSPVANSIEVGSVEERDYGLDQLSSSSTDALRLPAENSNVPIHLQAGDPLDIAGLVASRVYTFLLVGCGIVRPVINNLLTGILFLFQTASNGGAACLGQR
jgi:hypothetical protein